MRFGALKRVRLDRQPSQFRALCKRLRVLWLHKQNTTKSLSSRCKKHTSAAADRAATALNIASLFMI
jgi:hypothetical protein